jgi:hypothetical protein
MAGLIEQKLRNIGKDVDKLPMADLEIVDEFHRGGRKTTLESAGQMNLEADSHVIDIGSGLGEPAR